MDVTLYLFGNKLVLHQSLNECLTFIFVRTSMNFSGLLLFFVEIMSDEDILDRKMLYFVIFGQFCKFSFFSILSKNWP